MTCCFFVIVLLLREVGPWAADCGLRRAARFGGLAIAENSRRLEHDSVKWIPAQEHGIYGDRLCCRASQTTLNPRRRGRDLVQNSIDMITITQ